MCMSGNCQTCSDGKLFLSNFWNKIQDQQKSLKWFQWISHSECYIVKQPKEGTIAEALDDLNKQLPKSLLHSFIKDQQSNAYTTSKSSVTDIEIKECILQMDFSENYACVWQDEVQAAHWYKKQVTICTVMVYHRNKRMSVCIISDARDHEKNAVAAFTTKIMHLNKEEFSSVKSVDIWIDGPSSQFKN